MNARIKQIRKALSLSQDEFGRRLGVSNTAISKIENAENSLTEQMIKSICREFNVDYIWLTTGEGEMFSDTDNQALDIIERVLSGENEFTKRVFKAFAAFDDSDWKTLEKFIDLVAAGEKGEKKEAD